MSFSDSFKRTFKNIKWKRYTTYIVVGVWFAVLLLLDAFGALNSTASRLMMLVAVYAVLTVSLNLVVGVLGELSLGQAGFMAFGAYTGAIVSKALAASLPAAVYFPISLLAAGGMAAVFGLIIGIPVLRLKGDYIAIVTLAFCMIVYTLATNLSFTGGATGLKDIPQTTNYINAFIVLILAIIVIQNFVRSKHGRAIMSIRDNEIAARACGINITYYKLFAFTLAAFIAGVGGCLYAHTGPILRPSSMDYNTSIEILVMVVLGGMGSMTGSFIAAAVLTLLPEYLRFLDAYRMIIYAVVLILIMVVNNNKTLRALKDRIVAQVKGWAKALFARIFRRKKAVPAGAAVSGAADEGNVVSINEGRAEKPADNSVNGPQAETAEDSADEPLRERGERGEGE